MRVVMVVTIDCQSLGNCSAEETHIFRALADGLRRAATADMTVQANDRVGFRHHHVQIMRYQQDTAAGRIADGLDKIVESDFTRKVYAQHRLIQDQQIGLSGNGTRQ